MNKSRKAKNIIVLTLTVIAFVILLVCITAIDTSGTGIFYAGALLSMAWLFTFGYANGYFDSILKGE